MKKGAFIYIRVSTEEQVGEGHHSLSAQKSICSKLADGLGYEVIETFEDAGKSATSMKRGALQEMIERCREDVNVEAVIVQDTDRLARNTQDHLAIRSILKKAGVKLISASQPTIDDSPEGQMIDTIVASVNQFQSDITARKTLKGMQEKASKGWLPGKATLGYKNYTNKKGEQVVGFDEPAASLIRDFFNKYATGVYSIAYLRDHLFEIGLRSRTGKKLQYSRLNAILKNRFYLGELRWGGIHVEKAGHSALIDQNTFDRVQNVLAAHNRYANRRRKHDFLLRGFLYCEVCGHRLVAEKHLNKNVAYYHCAKKGKCPAKKYADTLDMELSVQQLFREVQFSEGFVNRITAKAKNIHEFKRKKIETTRLGLYAKMTKLDGQQDVLDNKMLNGSILDEDYQRMSNKIREDRKAIQSEVEKLDRVRQQSTNTLSKVLDLSRNVSEAYRKAPPELKKHYLSLFWERFEVNGYDVTKAVPSRLLQALRANANKPVLIEQASLHSGGRHPRQQAIATSGQLVTVWGHCVENIRTIILAQKV